MITGFLGAGKTTLLKRFLATAEGQGTAVVVNEFGAAGIDDALVRPSADETVLLGNGCLCCITRTDLQQALRRMVIERERGELPDFRLVLTMTDEEEWEGESRRIDPDMLRDHLGDLESKTFLVAGPPPMAEGVAESLKAAGVPEEQVLADKFSGY